MKSFFHRKQYLMLLFLPVMTGVIFFQTSCRRTIDPVPQPLPTKFTDLKIDPNFEFNSVTELQADISVSTNGAAGIQVIQIFEGDPASNGKLICMGSTDNTAHYKTTLKVPTRLKELYLGKISSTGIAYAVVPITGKTLVYEFNKSGGLKDADGISAAPNCSSGCTQTVAGTVQNLTINAGQTICVAAGTSATFKNLTLNSGGTIKACGTITFYNSVSGSGGTIIITPGGTLAPSCGYDNNSRTLNNYSSNMTYTADPVKGTINNYGTITFSPSSGNGTVNIQGTFNNYNTGSTTSHMNVQGTFVNQGPFTVQGKIVNTGSGVITNQCSIIQTGSNDFEQNNTLTNNGYIKVTGEFKSAGGSTSTLGSGSLIETKKFSIEGNLFGPASGSQPKAQLKANGNKNSKTTGGCTITNYIDLCSSHGISPNSGNIAPTVTYCAVTIPVPSCSTPTPPVITSALTAGGMVGQAFSYTITATGTPTITYNATGLPAGLTFSGSTISGSPSASGTFNVTLTADNNWGTDTKTLVITIAVPGTPPVITSPLTATATAGQPFSYTITASGTSPISYNATSLPEGLILTGNVISGAPVNPGTYNIPLTATNNIGTDNKTLVLTVGAPLIPPTITSSLTASATTGSQFTYEITATGTTPITYNATGLPPGLGFNGSTIQGVPTDAGIYNVTLTATNVAGTDNKVLVITVLQAPVPPVITSELIATGVVGQSFTYAITATGTTPITYTAAPLPAGLTYSDGVISGIPTNSGTTNVALQASNIAGTDDKTLVIMISNPAPTDTDGDGVPDDIDAYPLDPTRAFNSYYPNEVDFGTFVFEDLWPAYGDYDCNDLVVNFQYKIVTNAQNKVVDVISKFKIKAAGATFNNGFGLCFSTPPSNIESVTGCIKLGTAVEIDPKGYEAGHTDQTVVIPFDAVNTLLGRGMVNTVHGGYTVETTIQTVTMHLSTPQLNIGTPPYNPFIFVNQNRAKEVHMKDQPPTSKVDPGYFATLNDASNPAMGWYYRSSSALPWAFEIPVDFDYPLEEKDILTAYLHFAQWAQSSGAEYQDWYLDLEGYRNDANIY